MSGFEDGRRSGSPGRPARWRVLASHGARLGVCADDPHALDDLERRLPFGSRIEVPGCSVGVPPDLDAVFTLCAGESGAGASAALRLFLDSELLQSSHDLDDLRERLESELHFSVASHARNVLFVHAGVVGWRGRAILVPGRSMSGKTSLVAALLRAGAEYYSDEYAVVEERGLIRPYPRALGIRTKDGTVRKVSPESLGCPVGSQAIEAALVVSTHYSPGASFEPSEQSAARGLLSLIDNTVVVRERSSFALDRLTPIARRATVLEGPRGDADEAATWLLRYLDSTDARTAR